MQGFPIQPGTSSDKVVQQSKGGIFRFIQVANASHRSCFIMNSRAPQPLSALLSLSMRDGDTLKTYSGRYWEMYNEIDGNFDDIAINTFKSNLPVKHGLRKSLTGKLANSVRQLMDRINKYKRVKED